MKFDILYLDLDGTLLESHTGILNAIRYACKAMNLSQLDEEEMMTFIGPPLGEAFEKTFGLSEEESTEAVRIFREYYNRQGIFESELYDGVEDTLIQLKEKGYHLYIATSKPEYMAKRITAHYGIDHYFEAIEGTRVDGYLAKKADLLCYMVDHYLDGDATKAVMVGDRHHDLLGARQAGLRSIAAAWGYGPTEEIEECKPTAIADFPLQLVEVADQLNEV